MKGEQTDAKREVRGLMTRVRDMEGRGGERRKRGRTGLRSTSLQDRTKKKTPHPSIVHVFVLKAIICNCGGTETGLNRA